MIQLIQKGLVKSAHDVSDGGLAVCLAESALFSEGLGAEISLPAIQDVRLDALLFGEAQSRIVFTVDPGYEEAIDELLEGSSTHVEHLGTVIEGRFRISIGERTIIDLSVDEMQAPYEKAIPELMQRT